MTTYKPHKLIPGYKIDMMFASVEIVAIPETKLIDRCSVIYDSKQMVVNKEDSIKTIFFKDKFNRQPYRLFYFVWEPDKEQTKLF